MTISTSTAWEPVIGLEVHVQLKTASKIFCGCPTTFGAPANDNTCPVCLGHPGVLPVLNRHAVALALRLAAATESQVASESIFARKNYFYPDLPKGYQISQYDRPLAEGGRIELSDGRSVPLERIHMEEDAGKLLHEGPDSDRFAMVDFNRTGVPLVEVVGKPEIHSPQDARLYLQALHTLVTHLDVSDGNMEEGSLRCDANVSIHRPGTPLGTRTEVKNLNSFRNVERALTHEIERHIEIVEAGGTVTMETRGFDADRGVTYSMRGKEEAHDYRYFPEPDLPPLRIGSEWLDEVRATLPELPNRKRSRFQEEYGIPEDDAAILSGSAPLAEFFEAAARLATPRAVANWVLRDVLALCRERQVEIDALGLEPEGLAELVRLIDDGTISNSAGKEVLEEQIASGRPAAEIVQERGLAQVSDTAELEAQVDAVLAENPVAVASYREGKKQSLGFLMGRVMKATSGKANPRIVNQLLKERLDTP